MENTERTGQISIRRGVRFAHDLVIWLGLAFCAPLALGAEPLEPLLIADTAYPVPSGAIFVALNGDDTHAGTKAAPLRTVSRAIAIAHSGDTVVIRGGTYRESLPEIAKRLTIQPWPHEKVWLKGSRVVTGWAARGSLWLKEGWTHAFCADCFHPDNIDPAFPNAGLPAQLFIDGMPLTEVSSRSAVKAGTFFIDGAAERLFIGSDPSGRTVEATVHGTAFVITGGGAGTVVRGLGFAHYSPVAEPGLGGMVKGDAKGLTFENNTFAWSAVKGLSIYKPDATVRGNVFAFNGMMGLEAWQATGLAVTGNRFAFNNRERFVQSGPVSEAAGAKITVTRDPVITDNRFENNFATGLWLDINVSDATVTRNIVEGNLRHGIFYEISANAIIASNIVVDNRVSGIALADASGVKVYNNTLVGNSIAFIVQDDSRVNDDREEIRRGNSWVSVGNIFSNNLAVADGEKNALLIWARDFTGKLDAGDMIAGLDFNGYWRADATRQPHLVEWWRRGHRTVHDTFASYRSTTGKERNSILTDGEASDPFFADAASGNFALKPNSRARAAGRKLPSDVALAIGVVERDAPDLGALLGPGGSPVTPR